MTPGDEAAATAILTIMGTGVLPPSADHPAVAAYSHLFSGRHSEALASIRAAEPTPYTRAVSRQIEALCTGIVPAGADGRPDLTLAVDAATTAGAMAVFHTSEAAHIAGALDLCSAMLEAALDRTPPERAAVWLRLGLSRAQLFQGNVGQARASVELAARGAIDPLADAAVRCVRAMAAGFAGDRSAAAVNADEISARVGTATSYADAGLALLAAYGLAATGEPQAASALLRRGSGGAELPLLPPALRAYGYDMLIEAALADGDTELASWMLRDLDRLDVGGNEHLLAARETARARVGIATGDRTDGASRARAATITALSTGSALVAARAALAAALAAESSTTGSARAGLVSALRAEDLRAWLVRSLAHADEKAEDRSAWARLTPTQRTVARLAARGLRNHEIADLLVVSPRTVEAHIAAVLDTLGVNNRVGIVRAAPERRNADSALLARLTPRQREVALGIVAARTNAMIAADLGVSEKAVERHVRALFAELGVASRSAIAARLVGGSPGRENR